MFDSVEEDEYEETINKLGANVRCVDQAEGEHQAYPSLLPSRKRVVHADLFPLLPSIQPTTTLSSRRASRLELDECRSDQRNHSTLLSSFHAAHCLGSTLECLDSKSIESIAPFRILILPRECFVDARMLERESRVGDPSPEGVLANCGLSEGPTLCWQFHSCRQCSSACAPSLVQGKRVGDCCSACSRGPRCRPLRRGTAP